MRCRNHSTGLSPNCTYPNGGSQCSCTANTLINSSPTEKRRHGDGEAGPHEEPAVEDPAGAEAAEDAEEQGERDREEQGDEREAERHGQSLGDLFGDRLLAVERRAQITLHHVAQPMAVLDEERPVELELVTDLLDRTGLGVGPAGECLGRVARDERGEAEHDERDDQQHRNEGEQPPRDHPQHRIASPLLPSRALRARHFPPYRDSVTSGRRSSRVAPGRRPPSAVPVVRPNLHRDGSTVTRRSRV